MRTQISITASAAIVGIGIVTIVLLTANQPTSQVTLSIDGLREKYTTNDRIEFIVTMHGYGKYCGGPEVTITRVDGESEIIWSDASNIFTGMNCPEHKIDNVFRYGTADKPITIQKVGSYMVSVMSSDKPVEKKFTVTN